MSTNAARLSALEVTVANLDAKFDLLLARLEPAAPARTVTPKASKAKAVTQPKAEGKVYRSAKGKAQAKAEVDALWAKTLKKAGAKRAKDLTPAQMDAFRAGSKAIWAAVPKTRMTKAA